MATHHSVGEIASVIKLMTIKIKNIQSLEKIYEEVPNKDYLIEDIQALAAQITGDRGN